MISAVDQGWSCHSTAGYLAQSLLQASLHIVQEKGTWKGLC